MVGERIKGVLVYQDRISSGKAAFSDLRSNSAWDSVTGLFSRFGKNNRKLVSNVFGGFLRK